MEIVIDATTLERFEELAGYGVLPQELIEHLEEMPDVIRHDVDALNDSLLDWLEDLDRQEEMREQEDLRHGG